VAVEHRVLDPVAVELEEAFRDPEPVREEDNVSVEVLHPDTEEVGERVGLPEKESVAVPDTCPDTEFVADVDCD